MRLLIVACLLLAGCETERESRGYGTGRPVVNRGADEDGTVYWSGQFTDDPESHWYVVAYDVSLTGNPNSDGMSYSIVNKFTTREDAITKAKWVVSHQWRYELPDIAVVYFGPAKDYMKDDLIHGKDVFVKDGFDRTGWPFVQKPRPEELVVNPNPS